MYILRVRYCVFDYVGGFVDGYREKVSYDNPYALIRDYPNLPFGVPVFLSPRYGQPYYTITTEFVDCKAEDIHNYI